MEDRSRSEIPAPFHAGPTARAGRHSPTRRRRWTACRSSRHAPRRAFIRAKGGTSFSVPLGITLRGQEQREKLVQIIGREQATKLIGRYGGTTLYIPTCRQAFVDTRDRNINLERDELAREGLSERALVSVLAVRHGLSDRQIWRILKKSGPVRPDMAACAAARRVSRSSARC